MNAALQCPWCHESFMAIRERCAEQVLRDHLCAKFRRRLRGRGLYGPLYTPGRPLTDEEFAHALEHNQAFH